ncbi:MAG: hypothetical protein WC091_11625 [Sulfuricellaceae bacterium]
MRRTLPDFTDAERWCVETTLLERYGRKVEVEQADIELRLDPVLPQLTLCPALYWKEGAAFVISKIGDGRFRAQFFYSVREQYGTGREEYDDLAECVVTLLKLQADHEMARRKKQE